MLEALAAMILSGSLACTGGDWTQIYDPHFRRAALAFWPPERARYWCVLKAQGAAESGLDPGAVSRAGAQGIAQFMPGTWAETMRRRGWTGTPWDAPLAIRAQAAYMQRLALVWSAPRPEPERVELALASYNAGPGNIVKAQRRCHGARSWSGIAPCLGAVTGRHARETRTYLRRIAAYWQTLTGSPWASSVR
ncbi:MAG: transglycosylase SLT domain-containing protein [Defluviicoccus sp.]|nr:transglycosylase SLT domain-containing protein [Defluviicoccus sp.]